MSRSLPHLVALTTGRRAPAITAPRTLVVAVAVGLAISGAGFVGPPTLVSPAVAQVSDPGLASKISSVMKDSRITKGRTSAVVYDAATGSELFQRSGGRTSIPASNTKIITAAAAMHTLGPSYRFRTEVISRTTITGSTLDGRLYLKGYGDPTARVSDYAALAQRVRAAGIRTVTGKLVVDAGYFDSVRYNPTWKTSYADDYYAAPISAVTLAPNADYDSGTVIISYRAGSVGKKAKITTTPASAAAYLDLKNLTTTGKKGSSTTFSATRAHGSKTITLRGRVASGRSGSRLITVQRPDLYAAAVFRAELAKAGVTVRGVTTALPTPTSGRRVLGTDYSMPLSQLLVPFMKLSNNMHAEALTKAMGAKRSGAPGTWANGLAATRAYLSATGVPLTGLVLTDGSGLTRSNSITPRAMGTLLVKVQRESWFAAFKASLPVAGNSTRMIGGTLRRRMNGTRAANNAWAKTGTLTGVTALSGYVRGRDGRLYAFSMLSQYTGSSPRPVEDKLVVALAGWRR